MTFKRKSGGSWVDITSLKRRVSGAWVDCTVLKRRVSGAWVTVWQLAHTAVASLVSVAVANGSTSQGSTVTITGGVGPFTRLWSWHTGGSGMTLANTTTATVQINSTGTNVIRSGVLKCITTDTGNSNLQVTAFADVTIQHGTPV